MGQRFYRPKPDWLFECEVGDVFVENSGTMRVLRHMSVDRTGMLRFATFSIRHRSWTNRCYTVLDYSAMLTRGFRPTGARVRLDSAMDIAIEAAIKQPGRMKYLLRADDVVGIS